MTKYYFADGYEFDAEKGSFVLKKVNLEPVSGTFAEMKDSYTTYPYTCVKTSLTSRCEVLLKVSSLSSSSKAKAQYISYSSVDKASTRTNEYSSNAKLKIEDWYEKNIVGKKDSDGNLITNYIVDGTFCNERGIVDSSSNSGYLLNINTRFAGHSRLEYDDKIWATLKCSDINDKFSNTTAFGNGLLKYPVALITADEVALAGGKANFKNEYFEE